MAQLLAFRREIAGVMRVGRDLDGGAGIDLEAEMAQRLDLGGVVGEQVERSDAKPVQDAGGDAVLALVGGEAEMRVGLYRVEALVLQGVLASPMPRPSWPRM
jgi:hypothetical protein